MAESDPEVDLRAEPDTPAYKPNIHEVCNAVELLGNFHADLCERMPRTKSPVKPHLQRDRRKRISK